MREPMRAERHRATLLTIAIAVATFALPLTPLRAQEPAVQLQRWTEEITSSVASGRADEAIRVASRMVALVREKPELATLEHARVLHSVAVALHERGQYDEALPYYEVAVEIIGRLDIPESAPLLVQVIENYANTFFARGDPVTGCRLMAQALWLRNETLNFEHESFPQLLTALGEVASHLEAYGIYDAAEELLREVVRARRLSQGEDHPAHGVALNNLGKLLYVQGKYAEAEQTYRDAIRILASSVGTDHPDHIAALGNLAMVLQVLGDLGTAERLLREIIELRRRTQGTENAEYALALNNVAQLLFSKSRFDEAERLYREAVKIFEESVGTEREEYAVIVGNLGLLLISRADPAAAEPYLRKASEVYERLYGRSNPAYARSLFQLAMLLHREGKFDEASSHYEVAIGTWRELQLTRHPEYAQALIAFGRLRLIQYQLDDAEAAFREALEVVEATVGRDHHRYAVALKELARFHTTRAAYAEAEALFREALETMRRAVGEEDQEYLETLSELARMNVEKGNHAAAESIMRDVVAIQRRVHGPGHPTYASAVNTLAFILAGEAKYAEAEPLFREAIEIGRRHPEVDRPNYAAALNNYAQLLVAIGNFSAAIPLFLESIEVERALHGTEHPMYARAVNNLAWFYHSLGKDDEAEPLFREAVGILAATVGTVHPEYATAIANLAASLRNLGRGDEAISIMRESVEILRGAVGERHPSFALQLNNLAVGLMESGEPEVAETIFADALEIGLQLFGPHHPDNIRVLLNMGALNSALGRPDSARVLIQRALEAQQQLLEQVFSFTSERGMLAYAGTAQMGLFFFLTILDEHPLDDAASALHWVLARKGAVLSALSTYRQVERIAAADPEVAATISQLHQTRKLLTDLTLNPLAGVPPDSLTQLISSLNERREVLEVSLQRTLSAHLGRDEGSGTLGSPDRGQTVDGLRRTLPAGGALVEFVRYFKLDLNSGRREVRLPVPHYAALVLQADGPVRWVPLGEAEEVERAVRDLRTAHMGCESGERSTFCSESSYKATAEEAYLRIFDALEPHLEGVEQLFLSPDGELNQVPFGALVDLGGQYLIERFRIAYLSSGRDLLRQQDGGKRAAGTVVFAGPSFDVIPAAKGGAPGEVGRSGQRAQGDVAYGTTLRSSAAPEALRSLKWEELPGALAEADDVKMALEGTERGPITIHTGERATEDSFKATRAPRILHLATHGFFIPERELSPEERAQCLAAGTEPGQASSLESGMGRGIERLRCAENPLLRSGIVLAGANAVGAADAAEDGWVLAEEIATLDLAGTELVVLSACETGLGDLKNGEGVYGLRRAFQLAGAEKILMSLFKVPDSATRDLLAGFYRSLAAGVSAEEALRESQLELRTKHPHPFYWASFVLVGTGR